MYMKRVVWVWLAGSPQETEGGGVDVQEEGGVGVAGRKSTGDRRGGVDAQEEGGVGVAGRKSTGDRGGGVGAAGSDCIGDSGGDGVHVGVCW